MRFSTIMGAAVAVALAVPALAEGIPQRDCKVTTGCTDFKPANAAMWHDEDGEKYTCAYYAGRDNCKVHGNNSANFGKTANQACCVCGGGVREEKEEETTGESTTCVDKSQEDGAAWYGQGGSKYNCNYYEQRNGCEKWGHRFENFGMVAKQACCACGGGEIISVAEPEKPLDDVVYDLMKLENEQASNTDHQLSKAALVVRRGEDITLKGPAAEFTLRPVVQGYESDLPIVSTTQGDKQVLELDVSLPIGRHTLYANGKSLGTIVILFNPYNKDDTVYMADESDREGYLKPNIIRYYAGNVYGYPSSLAINGLQWQSNIGSVLDDVLDLLEYSVSDWEDCGNERFEADLADPVIVSRIMSFMGSNAGTHGVLQGRWSGDYEDGKRPGYWSGTQQILDQWKKNNHTPVKYAQCWVFGNTLTTFMRSLGVPARVVTNFNSAHDVPNGEMKTHYGTEPKYDWIIDEDTDDSVWNFHVWVNVWFTRPDLDAKNIGIVPHKAGWNSIDSTPQEPSDGEYQMGPANHADLKANYAKGNQYDTRFVMGEVNAHHPEKGKDWVGRYTLTGLPSEPAECASLFRISHTRDRDLMVCSHQIQDETRPLNEKPPRWDSTLDMRRRASHAAERSFDITGVEEYYIGEDIVLYVTSLHQVPIKDAAITLTISGVEYTGHKIDGAEALATATVPDSISDSVATFVIPAAKVHSVISKTVDFRATAVITAGNIVETDHFRFTLEAEEPVVVPVKDEEGRVVVTWRNPLSEPIKDIRITANGGILEEKDFLVLGARETLTTSFFVPCAYHGLVKDNEVIISITTPSIDLEHLQGVGTVDCME